jgi:tetratricopeptide (TPR) repeat protein
MTNKRIAVTKERPAQEPRSAGRGTLVYCDALIRVGLVISVLIAYAPALRGTLLWDDNSHITRPEMQSWHGLWRIWAELGATQQYYPLLHTALWVEHRFWGDAVLGYHLVNVALHALAACLVFSIGRRLALAGASAAAFVFALHPVAVEAVAWISEQKSTLSAVFYLAAALLYLRFDATRAKRSYFLAFAMFVLALLTKTVTATLPAVLLVIVWWKRGRIDKRDVMPLIPWLSLGAGAGLFTAWVERSLIGASGADFDLTVLQRVLLAGRVLCFYAGKLLWPVDLTFTYPRWTIDGYVWWQYLFPMAVVVAAIGCWRMARRNRGPLAAFLIFVGTLFPVLGFLNVYPFRFSYVADHFQYLASLGIIVPVTSGWYAARRSGNLVSAVAAAILGILTFQQSEIYINEETLYRVTLARNPMSWMAHHNLAKAIAETPGRLSEAVTEYEAALRIYPNFPETHNNLGNALSRIPGRLPEAIRELEIALRLNPNYAEAHYNLANVLAQVPGRLSEATDEYRVALKIEPGMAEAHHNLGIALAQTPGKLAEAIQEFQAALRIDPRLAEAHNDLGRALSQIGRVSEALAECEAAIRMKPDLAPAYNNRGMILSQIPGRMEDAIASYSAALQMHPDYADAHNNLGSALAESGRLAEAIREFEIALRIRPEFPDAQGNLERAQQMLQGVRR